MLQFIDILTSITLARKFPVIYKILPPYENPAWGTFTYTTREYGKKFRGYRILKLNPDWSVIYTPDQTNEELDAEIEPRSLTIRLEDLPFDVKRNISGIGFISLYEDNSVWYGGVKYRILQRVKIDEDETFLTEGEYPEPTPGYITSWWGVEFRRPLEEWDHYIHHNEDDDPVVLKQYKTASLQMNGSYIFYTQNEEGVIEYDPVKSVWTWHPLLTIPYHQYD